MDRFLAEADDGGDTDASQDLAVEDLFDAVVELKKSDGLAGLGVDGRYAALRLAAGPGFEKRPCLGRLQAIRVLPCVDYSECGRNSRWCSAVGRSAQPRLLGIN